MTLTTAEYFGLTDRGEIREGTWADLVLFDAQTAVDRATYTDPHQYPEGIPYVVVNGVVVIDVRGTPREWGRQQGEGGRLQVAGMLAAYSDLGEPSDIAARPRQLANLHMRPQGPR